MALNIDITKLQNLGFSENDAKVYLCLAELKKSTADQVISKTGLHRSIVYTALEHLSLRKLVETTEANKKRTFSAISPSQLVSEFQDKAQIAEELAQTIGAKLSADSQEITIYRGNEEYLLLLTSLIKSLPVGGTKYVLGTGGKEFMNETMLPIWDIYHRVARKQKIRIQMIGYESQKNAIEPYISKEGMYETKYLPSDMENPAGVHIYPEANTVLNIIYSDKTQEVTAIKIRSKAFVRSNLNLFESLWQKAK
jgi:predicted transcriptional regulator